MMTKIVINLPRENREIMEDVARSCGLNLTSWARSTLIEAARVSPYSKIKSEPERVLEKKYKWLGKPCTKEVWEAGTRKNAAISSGAGELPSDVLRELENVTDDEPL